MNSAHLAAVENHQYKGHLRSSPLFPLLLTRMNLGMPFQSVFPQRAINAPRHLAPQRRRQIPVYIRMDGLLMAA